MIVNYMNQGGSQYTILNGMVNKEVVTKHIMKNNLGELGNNGATTNKGMQKNKKGKNISCNNMGGHMEKISKYVVIREDIRKIGQTR